jgi:hypothetical protein
LAQISSNNAFVDGDQFMEQDHPAGNRHPEYVFAPMQGRLGRGILRLSFNYFGPLMRTISRILAATDFSSAGHAALARAGQLAAQHTAELHVDEAIRHVAGSARGRTPADGACRDADCLSLSG